MRLPKHKLLIFTGPIDAFYANQGSQKLEYRSIFFEVRVEFIFIYKKEKSKQKNKFLFLTKNGLIILEHLPSYYNSSHFTINFSIVYTMYLQYSAHFKSN